MSIKLSASLPSVVPEIAGPIESIVDGYGVDIYLLSKALTPGTPQGVVEFELNGQWLLYSVEVSVYLTSISLNISNIQVETDTELKINLPGNFIRPVAGGTTQYKPIFGGLFNGSNINVGPSSFAILSKSSTKIRLTHSQVDDQSRYVGFRIRAIPIK